MKVLQTENREKIQRRYGSFTIQDVILPCLLLIILPNLFSTKTVDISLLPQWICLTVAGIYYFLHKIIISNYKRVILPKGLAGTAFALYCLSNLGGILYAGNKHAVLMECFKVMSFVLIFIIFRTEFYEKSDAKKLYLICINISAVVLSIVGFFQLSGIGFTNIPGNVFPYGSMGNRNVFIPALLLLLPFCALQYKITLEKSQRIISATACLGILLLVCLSGMRSALLALSALFLVLFLFAPKTDSQINKELLKKRLVRTFFWISFIMFIIVVGIVPFLTGKWQTLLNLNSIVERWALWKNTFLMINDHFWFGVGAGNWPFLMPQYGLGLFPQEVRMGDMIYVRPENDVLWTFAECGIVGGLSYLTLLILPFIQFMRFADSRNLQQQYSQLFTCISSLIWIIISLGNFPKERPFLLLEFAFILAFSFSLDEEKTEAQGTQSIHAGYGLILFAVSLFFLVGSYKSEIISKKIVNQYALQQYSDIPTLVEKATASGDNTDPAKTPFKFYSATAHYLQGKLKEATLDYQEALQANPNHLHTLNSLSACYAALKKEKEAENLLLYLLKISLGHIQEQLNLSAI